MIKKVFAVRDRKADMFSQPFVALNEAMALRMFEYAKANKDGDVGRFPDDFDLYLFGTWDDESGRFDCGLPVLCGSGQQSLFAKEA